MADLSPNIENASDLPQGADGETKKPRIQPDEISDIHSIWIRHNSSNEDVKNLKGLEYFTSPNSNRIMIKHTGCCSHIGSLRFVIEDRSKQKIYKVRGGRSCQRSVLATVVDFRKKEILRFQKEKSDTLSVIYRGDQKIGQVIACRKMEALADSYLLYILTGANGEELLRIFSKFDDPESCWKNESITCYVLRNQPPYEIGSFEHISNGCFTNWCSPISSYTRDSSFRCDFNENLDPFTKCLVLAAAYWRMADGFRRYKSSGEDTNGWFGF